MSEEPLVVKAQQGGKEKGREGKVVGRHLCGWSQLPDDRLNGFYQPGGRELPEGGLEGLPRVNLSKERTEAKEGKALFIF